MHLTLLKGVLGTPSMPVHVVQCGATFSPTANASEKPDENEEGEPWIDEQTRQEQMVATYGVLIKHLKGDVYLKELQGSHKKVWF